MENIHCTASANAISIDGLEEMPIKNITFKNVTIRGNKGIDIKLAENIKLENVKVSSAKDGLQKVSFDSQTITGEFITEF